MSNLYFLGNSTVSQMLGCVIVSEGKTVVIDGGTLGDGVPTTVNMQVGGGATSSFNNDDVKAAFYATRTGYTFSGWDKEDFTMPDEDVIINGSWTTNRRKM